MVVWSVGGPLILAIGASTLGWLLVRAAGATNEVAVAAAVPCAVVLVTLFGLLQIVVAVPFSWWSVALLGALLALAARLVRRRTRRSTRSSPAVSYTHLDVYKRQPLKASLLESGIKG